MQICNINQCTGCMACMNVCPQNAITESCDEKGFYVPLINSNLCVECGLCKTVCPQNKNVELKDNSPKVFACWNKDDKVRKCSTSGGVFSLLADKVLEDDGIVFGAVYNSELEIIMHTNAYSKKEIEPMRGSKYVQSKIGYTYKNVRDAVISGRKVLFSGTPCQISALRSFLEKEYDNIILVDILCHGVPSPLVFSSYLNYVKKSTANTKVTEIHFRDKEKSWELFNMKVCFSDGNSYKKDMNNDPFHLCFLNNYCLRNSCYECKYTTTSRQGDITLGDFWGYISETSEYQNDDKGISLVLVNTKKGEKWFSSICHHMEYVEKSLKEAIMGNIVLDRPTPCAKESDMFWKTFQKNKDIIDCIPLYLKPSKIRFRHKLRLWLDSHCYLMPSIVKNAYINLKIQRANLKNQNEK